MNDRLLEQVGVGAVVALITAFINQAFAGKVGWWPVATFFVAIILYTVYSRLSGFPFGEFRVKATDNNHKDLIAHADPLDGRRVGEAWQFRTKTRDNGDAITAIWGPYLQQPLRKGKYRAIFRLKLDDVSRDNCPIVDIDISSGLQKTGDKRLGVRTLSTLDFRKADEYQNFPVDFDLCTDEQTLELRVFSRGNGHQVTFDSVRLTRRLI